jgi:UDP-N-acetylglucosamine 2-epimerase (non-hydrolysing)
VENLKHEGAPPENIFLVGNVMIDSLLRHREAAAKSPILEKLGVRQNGSGCLPYGVLTLHRPSNVDDKPTLHGILEAVRSLTGEIPIFFPLHPRTRNNIERFGLQHYLADTSSATQPSGIIPLEPLGYLDFLSLNARARIVLTDSGGVQEETTVLGVPCLTLRENTERPATVEHGTNQVVGVKPEVILAAAQSILRTVPPAARCPPLWDGKAAQRIVPILMNYLHELRSKFARGE